MAKRDGHEFSLFFIISAENAERRYVKGVIFILFVDEKAKKVEKCGISSFPFFSWRKG